MEDGKLVGWAWVSSENNPADYCTKPCTVRDLVVGGFWERGPDFLLKDESKWPIRFSYKKDNLEGELQIPKQAHCGLINQVINLNFIDRLVERCSSWKKMTRVLAWMKRVVGRSGFLSNSLSPEEVSKARADLIRYAQKELVSDLSIAAESGTGRFRKLAPILDKGIWRVGSRMRHLVHFTVDSKLPVLLPLHHRITLLIMRESHQFCHAGQDGTLSRFRAQGFWGSSCRCACKEG